jgi:hypothetical protein
LAIVEFPSGQSVRKLVAVELEFGEIYFRGKTLAPISLVPKLERFSESPNTLQITPAIGFSSYFFAGAMLTISRA